MTGASRATAAADAAGQRGGVALHDVAPAEVRRGLQGLGAAPAELRREGEAEVRRPEAVRSTARPRRRSMEAYVFSNSELERFFQNSNFSYVFY